MSIGKSYYEQGNYLKAVQYYQQSIHLINVNADKPWVNPGQVIICYYRLNVIYDSLNRFSDELKASTVAFPSPEDEKSIINII
jgi:tetratricopeptide (TPR) repeat protein